MTKVISIMLLLLLCSPIFCQEQSTNVSINIRFSLGESVVDTAFRGNKQELESIFSFLKQAEKNPHISISKIIVDSYASPEGGRLYNDQLSKKRTEAICDYLTRAVSVPDSLIEAKHSGTNWDGLYNLVKESDMAYGDDVLNIIENTPEETWRRVNPNDRWMTLVDSRLKRLKELRYGNPYRYMAKKFFPSLREGSVVTIYSETIAQPTIEEITEDVSADTIKTIETISIPEMPQATNEAIETTVETNRKPIKFALKTNLLYYALLTPSIEIEVPIGNRWSVAGEWMFPWWILDNGSESSSRCRLQILNGNIEGKYWFGDRSIHDELTGWYCGLYSGAGLYDLEYKAKGYQGELFIAAGLSGGYAHTINKSGALRMEYSLSMGYLKTKYRYYETSWGDDNTWHPVRQENGNYTWIGPTRARVSLVWMIGNKSKKGGRNE